MMLKSNMTNYQNENFINYSVSIQSCNGRHYPHLRII